MKILGTTALSFEIEQLINEETSFLIIVSPYLKLTDRLRAKMDKNFQFINKVIFLYREKELTELESKWLDSNKNILSIPIKNLHAKIYVNEHRCIISSMNLYEYSQINNHEIGIELNSKDNRSEFSNVLEEVNLMISSQNIDINISDILDRFCDYSIGQLFYKYMSKYRLYGKGLNKLYYRNFCDWAQSKVKFQNTEIHINENIIKQGTDLGRERYEILRKTISQEVILKNN